MERVLVFFPHNPFPPRTGAHQRCLQITQGLAAAGVEVHFASSTFTSDIPWGSVSQAEYNAAGIHQIHLHHSTIWDTRYIKYWNQAMRRLRRPSPLSSPNHAPPSLVRWFHQLADQLRPDVILINYAFWDRLLNPRLRRQTRTVMDMLDLLTLYRQRYGEMEHYFTLPPFSVATIDPQILRPDFFPPFKPISAATEFQIYDRYDVTLAITPSEGALLQANTHHTQVVVLPMTFQPVPLANTYSGSALYPASSNPFNIQGYLYFAGQVLPKILLTAPDFELDVTGSLCRQVLPTPGIRLNGFVNDLLPFYQVAPFLICPVLGKTGQQIKIIEAMAHGVPVIATRAGAEGSPIRHAENGLIAQDADEFAAHAIRLWHDRALCRTLGQAARATIVNEFSATRLQAGLAVVLNSHS